MARLIHLKTNVFCSLLDNNATLVVYCLVRLSLNQSLPIFWREKKSFALCVSLLSLTVSVNYV